MEPLLLSGSFISRDDDDFPSLEETRDISLSQHLKKFDHIKLNFPQIAGKYFKNCPFQHAKPWCKVSNKPVIYCSCEGCCNVNLIWKMEKTRKEYCGCLLKEWENLKKKKKWCFK